MKSLRILTPGQQIVETPPYLIAAAFQRGLRRCGTPAAGEVLADFKFELLLVIRF